MYFYVNVHIQKEIRIIHLNKFFFFHQEHVDAIKVFKNNSFKLFSLSAVSQEEMQLCKFSIITVRF